MLRLPLAHALLSIASAAHAQFEIQDSTTTADLRGIVSVGNGTAWASGTHGTVLRTEDSGFVWQGCTTPPGAEKLDFRGIQAFDDRTAIVMSSGKGDLSRIYKTTDGCVTWKLVFTNPDAEGFFDAIGVQPHSGAFIVLGDPVHNAFPVFVFSPNLGALLHRVDVPSTRDEAVFAASNSSMWLNDVYGFCFVTGGSKAEQVCSATDGEISRVALPFESNASSGAFSYSYQPELLQMVAVGGNYRNPDQLANTAAWANLRYRGWSFSQTFPHGYRSSVTYDSKSKNWITVGPNGTDISTDDGKNWHPLRPSKDDQPDADRNWNALSLPFVVGPHGRIGRLRDDVLQQAASQKPSHPVKP